MVQSKKHHYIPRFYLEGFTGTEGKYFVYDKQADKIWETNPANSFAENHRNTGELPNLDAGTTSYSDAPESMLSYLDGLAAKVIALFTNLSENSRISQDQLLHLQLFIASLFWRVPANDNLRKQIFESHSFRALGFGIFHKETKERSPEMEDVLKNVEVFEKSYQTFLPIVSFLGQNRRNLTDLEIYYRADDKGIISDNPVLIKEFKDFRSLKGELVFPLSRSYWMVLTEKEKPAQLSRYVENHIDILLFLNAKRFVACHNKQYLEFLCEEFKKYDGDVRLKAMFYNHIFDNFKVDTSLKP